MLGRCVGCKSLGWRIGSAWGTINRTVQAGSTGFVVPNPPDSNEPAPDTTRKAPTAQAAPKGRAGAGKRRFGVKKAKAPDPSAHFARDAAAQLAKVAAGVARLGAQNPGMSVVLSAPPGTRLEVNFEGEESQGLGGGNAQFVVVALPEEEELQVYTSISGLWEYQLCSTTRRWVSVKHGTDMDGMLTRDMLRVCVGCPEF